MEENETDLSFKDITYILYLLVHFNQIMVIKGEHIVNGMLLLSFFVKSRKEFVVNKDFCMI